MFSLIRTYNGLRFGLAAVLVVNLVLPALVLACAPQYAGHGEEMQSVTVEASTNERAMRSDEVVHVHASGAHHVAFLFCPTPTDDRWECCDVTSVEFDRMVLTRVSNELADLLIARLAVISLFAPAGFSDSDAPSLSDRQSHRPYSRASARVHLLISSFLL